MVGSIPAEVEELRLEEGESRVSAAFLRLWNSVPYRYAQETWTSRTVHSQEASEGSAVCTQANVCSEPPSQAADSPVTSEPLGPQSPHCGGLCARRTRAKTPPVLGGPRPNRGTGRDRGQLWVQTGPSAGTGFTEQRKTFASRTLQGRGSTTHSPRTKTRQTEHPPWHKYGDKGGKEAFQEAQQNQARAGAWNDAWYHRSAAQRARIRTSRGPCTARRRVAVLPRMHEQTEASLAQRGLEHGGV